MTNGYHVITSYVIGWRFYAVRLSLNHRTRREVIRLCSRFTFHLTVWNFALWYQRVFQCWAYPLLFIHLFIYSCFYVINKLTKVLCRLIFVLVLEGLCGSPFYGRNVLAITQASNEKKGELIRCIYVYIQVKERRIQGWHRNDENKMKYKFSSTVFLTVKKGKKNCRKAIVKYLKVIIIQNFLDVHPMKGSRK